MPPQRADSLFSTFVQDEIRLSNSLWFTLGSKFEHNNYTGFEYEPSARLVWTPASHQTVWWSASRAIRQPARADVQIQVDLARFPLDDRGFGIVKLFGTLGRKAERLHDFEAGYRAQIGGRLSLDIAAFASWYLGLQTNEPGVPYFTFDPGPPHLVVPIFFENGAHGRTYGGEAFANWSVTRRWRIRPGFSFIHMNVAGYSFSRDPAADDIASDTPKHRFHVRSLLNLTNHLDWDSALSFVGLREDTGNGSTPSHIRVDSRLGWRIGETIELSIAGQNLSTPTHSEFHDAFGTHHTLVERRVFGKVTWRF